MDSRKGNLTRICVLVAMIAILIFVLVSGVSTAAEKKILIYTPYSSYQMDPLIAKFNQKYPDIKVEYLPGGKEQILTMVDLEVKTGQVKGDIMLGIDPLTADYLNKSLESYQPSAVNQLVPSVKDPDGKSVAYGTNFVVIQYNTKLIPKKDAPTSFADLLDPKFTNKMSHADPRMSGTAHLVIYFLTQYCKDKFGDPYGWAFYEKFAELNPLILSGQGGIRDYVETGERPMGAEQSITMVIPSMAGKASTDYVLPKEGCPSSIDSAGIFKGAPHSNTAKIFVAFLISKEGQLSVAKDLGLAPVRKAVAFTLPHGEGMEKVNLVPVAKFLTVAKKAEQSEKFHQIIDKK